MPRTRSRSRSRSRSSRSSSSSSSSSPSHSDSRCERRHRRHSSSSSSKHKHHRHHSDRGHRHNDSSRVRPAARVHKHSPPLENLTFLSWVHQRLRIPAAQCSQSQLKSLWSKFRHKWNSGHFPDAASSPPAARSAAAAIRGPMLPSRSSSAFDEKQEAEAEARKMQSKMEFKRQQANLDALCPKPDAGSLEARREKKAAVTSFARQRDDSPEMRDRDVLGGDERQQFSRLVAARKREQDIKDRDLLERKAAYAAKEKEKMLLLLQSCGMHHLLPGSHEKL